MKTASEDAYGDTRVWALAVKARKLTS